MHKRKLIISLSTLLLPVLFSFAAYKTLGISSDSWSTQATAIAQNKSPAKVESPIALPADFQYPNGIARAQDGTLYVGSVTSGHILQIAPNGRIETFFPGNNDIFAANSLRLDEPRNILWGASSDFLGVRNARGEVVRRPHRIFALDRLSGKVLHVILMPKGGFGNDLALDADGGVYLTDSTLARIHYLAPGSTQLQTWVTDERFQDKRIGLGGIARRADGVLVVGHYSNGTLFKVTPQPQGQPKVEVIPLERSLENPDGMQFATDGSLILTEGAATSGKGRLLRINVFSPGTDPKAIETLAENLKSPVNLTLNGKNIWVTESQIRHRFRPGEEGTIPDRFFVHRFFLP
jgi:streptogramin lyase